MRAQADVEHEIIMQYTYQVCHTALFGPVFKLEISLIVRSGRRGIKVIPSGDGVITRSIATDIISGHYRVSMYQTVR